MKRRNVSPRRREPAFDRGRRFLPRRRRGAAYVSPPKPAATSAQGGNAIEAMVAMAAGIAVVYPHMNSIGGDGFWLIRDAKGKVRAIEACGFAGENATSRATRLGGIPTRGPMAALTVPGAIGGWKIALELSAALGGRLPLPTCSERGERQAREGVPVSPSEPRFEPRDDADALRRAELRRDLFPRRQAAEGRRDPQAAEARRNARPSRPCRARRFLSRRRRARDRRRSRALGSPVTRADLKAYQRALARAAVARG